MASLLVRAMDGILGTHRRDTDDHDALRLAMAIAAAHTPCRLLAPHTHYHRDETFIGLFRSIAEIAPGSYGERPAGRRGQPTTLAIPHIRHTARQASRHHSYHPNIEDR
jgi:hypothetical protein